MIQSPSDFEDATAFERFVLARAIPILDASSKHQSSLDLRGGAGKAITIAIAETATVGGGNDASIREAVFRPLFFGAAWKVLDLAMELAFWQAGIRPNVGSNRWTIMQKKTLAQARRAQRLL